MKIRSQAQLAMFQRAASDAAYATERGITQDLAREHLKTHEAAGSPDLPERAIGIDPRCTVELRVGKIGDRPQPKDVRPLFLASMRG